MPTNRKAKLAARQRAAASGTRFSAARRAESAAFAADGLSELADWLGYAPRRGDAVAVGAHSGVGKTRFLLEAARRADAAGRSVRWVDFDGSIGLLGELSTGFSPRLVVEPSTGPAAFLQSPSTCAAADLVILDSPLERYDQEGYEALCRLAHETGSVVLAATNTQRSAAPYGDTTPETPAAGVAICWLFRTEHLDWGNRGGVLEVTLLRSAGGVAAVHEVVLPPIPERSGPRTYVPLGIAEIDAALGGGLRCGELTVFGVPGGSSSGALDGIGDQGVLATVARLHARHAEGAALAPARVATDERVTCVSWRPGDDDALRRAVWGFDPAESGVVLVDATTGVDLADVTVQRRLPGLLEMLRRAALQRSLAVVCVLPLLESVAFASRRHAWDGIESAGAVLVLDTDPTRRPDPETGQPDLLLSLVRNERGDTATVVLS